MHGLLLRATLPTTLDPIPFEQFRDSLQPVGVVPALDAATRAAIKEAADALAALPEGQPNDPRRTHPGASGMGSDPRRLLPAQPREAQERAPSCLGTEGRVTLARKNPSAIIDLLDERYDLVEEVIGQREREWTLCGLTRGATIGEDDPTTPSTPLTILARRNPIGKDRWRRRGCGNPVPRRNPARARPVSPSAQAGVPGTGLPA